MKRRKSRIDEALDAWSDFAIDSWLFALRFAGLLIAMLLFATLSGKMGGERWAALPDMWQEMAFMVFGVGIALAGAYRIDSALVRQRRVRHRPDNGGRTPSKRAARRERARRKGNRQ